MTPIDEQLYTNNDLYMALVQANTDLAHYMDFDMDPDEANSLRYLLSTLRWTVHRFQQLRQQHVQANESQDVMILAQQNFGDPPSRHQLQEEEEDDRERRRFDEIQRQVNEFSDAYEAENPGHTVLQVGLTQTESDLMGVQIEVEEVDVECEVTDDDDDDDRGANPTQKEYGPLTEREDFLNRLKTHTEERGTLYDEFLRLYRMSTFESEEVFEIMLILTQPARTVTLTNPGPNEDTESGEDEARQDETSESSDPDL